MDPYKIENLVMGGLCILLLLVFLVLLVLKCCGIIAISWLAVISPILVPFIIFGILATIIYYSI